MPREWELTDHRQQRLALLHYLIRCTDADSDGSLRISELRDRFVVWEVEQRRTLRVTGGGMPSWTVSLVGRRMGEVGPTLCMSKYRTAAGVEWRGRKFIENHS